MPAYSSVSNSLASAARLSGSSAWAEKLLQGGILLSWLATAGGIVVPPPELFCPPPPLLQPHRVIIVIRLMMVDKFFAII